MIQTETLIWIWRKRDWCIRMRDKKLVAVCILALVIFSAFMQVLPEASQHEDTSAYPSERIFAFSEQDLGDSPCGGGGGDDAGGGNPL